MEYYGADHQELCPANHNSLPYRRTTLLLDHGSMVTGICIQDQTFTGRFHPCGNWYHDDRHAYHCLSRSKISPDEPGGCAEGRINWDFRDSRILGFLVVLNLICLNNGYYSFSFRDFTLHPKLPITMSKRIQEDACVILFPIT